MQSFICVAEVGTIHFCRVDRDGTIHKLNVIPEGPTDYLNLWHLAQDSGLSVGEMAEVLVDHGQRMPWTLDELDVTPHPSEPYLILPCAPPEVWGAAFTYLRDDQSLDSPLIQERRSTEPVIFFKATPHRYVGPNEAVGSRADAKLMIPEPELGVILSSSAEIIGYTLVNDVSSRDFPQRDPLYVTYSKIFDRCVSFGPAVVAPESIGDPLDLDITCRVSRDGQVIWEQTGNTGRIYWSHAELIAYASAHNHLPHGTLLATGTVLSPPADLHITEGDLLEVECSGLGRLANPVVIV